MPQESELYPERPQPVKSGPPIEYRIRVQHRSNILLQEQVENVQNVQEALQVSLSELERSKTGDEMGFYKAQVEELKEKLEEMMLTVKVVHKLNSELMYARADLQKALKTQDADIVDVARRRVGWLEERMERVLGKTRQRSPARAKLRSSVYEDQRHMMDSGDRFEDRQQTLDSRDSGRPGMGRHFEDDDDDDDEYDDRFTDSFLTYHQDLTHGTTFENGSPDQGLPYSSALTSIDTLLSFKSEPTFEAPAPASEVEKGIAPGPKQVSRHTTKVMEDRISEQSEPETTPGSGMMEVQHLSSSQTSQSSGTASRRHHVATSSPSNEYDKSSISKSAIARGRKERDNKGSKESHVTIKSPSEMDIILDPRDEEEMDEPADYWNSEHHRFEYGEHAGALCQNNPLSYHKMGLAVPGTFVEEVQGTDKLPWRQKRRGSDTTDIHKHGLNNLSNRVHKMLSKVREAALFSTQMNPSSGNTNLASAKTIECNADDEQVSLSLRDPVNTDLNKPSIARILNKDEADTSDSFPRLDNDRLGSSMSGRLVYYPAPLPYPEKLPITRTSYDQSYPRETEKFSGSVPGVADPAERIVNQRNLLSETKFTGSLYRPRPLGIDGGGKKMAILPGISPPESGDVSKRKSFKMALGTVKSMVKIKDGEEDKKPEPITGKWKVMKPKSGVLEHTGLKWERVKDIVHHNLVSPYLQERIDAVKHLGALKCGDTLVMFALKQRLQLDDEVRVRYEATKSLIMLGCWEEEVIESLVNFLIDGNRDIRTDLLHSMSRGKNIQFVNKKLPSFPELTKILSILCLGDDSGDESISLDAAVCLGKLCVSDDNAKNKLKQIMTENRNTHVKAEALEILIRQLNYKEFDIVEATLDHLRKSPSWKNRRDAAKLLIYLGKKNVCVNNEESERTYAILENRLWDEPNKAVRDECAKAMAALDMYARACEQAEKRLDDTGEEVRAQAVITLGTLNVKSERIIRSLVEMLELDSSEYVRLVIMRIFAQLNVQDKRVIRALRDKERGEGPLSRESRKTLKRMGMPPATSLSKYSNMSRAAQLTGMKAK